MTTNDVFCFFFCIRKQHPVFFSMPPTPLYNNYQRTIFINITYIKKIK